MSLFHALSSLDINCCGYVYQCADFWIAGAIFWQHCFQIFQAGHFSNSSPSMVTFAVIILVLFTIIWFSLWWVPFHMDNEMLSENTFQSFQKFKTSQVYDQNSENTYRRRYIYMSYITLKYLIWCNTESIFRKTIGKILE